MKERDFDDKENYPDQVGGRQVERGETAKFLQSFHVFLPY